MIRRLLRQRKEENVDPSAASAGDKVSVGKKAPDFRLESDSGELISLGDLRGRPAVLVFYPRDNSSVCSSQLALYNEAYHMFEEHDAQLVGISVDDQRSHQAFANALGLQFSLLSDDDPLGKTARIYGVLDESDKVAERALFVLDADGVIRWRYVAPRGLNPGANGILEALESLEDEGA